ncbi:SDR family NAD(P)-dependent oxidoreductase [Chloroflexota bacterium]
MFMSISGKTCLITGANTGLGLAVSKRFVDMGANTILLCRNKEKGENAVLEIKKETPNVSVDLPSSVILCQASLSSGTGTLQNGSTLLPREK